MQIVLCDFLTYSPATKMHLVQHFFKALILLKKNCCSWSFSLPFAVQYEYKLQIW